MELNAASNEMVEETKQVYSSLLQKSLQERQLLRPSFKFILDLVLSVSSWAPAEAFIALVYTFRPLKTRPPMPPLDGKQIR